MRSTATNVDVNEVPPPASDTYEVLAGLARVCLDHVAMATGADYLLENTAASVCLRVVLIRIP